jgi:hypothetical protein
MLERRGLPPSDASVMSADEGGETLPPPIRSRPGAIWDNAVFYSILVTWVKKNLHIAFILEGDL